MNGKYNNYEITMQFSKPSSDNSSENLKASSFVYGIECSSIYSGINSMNNYISKEIDLSHCKAIVFSELIAENGISKEVHCLINDIQIRPDISIIVSKCDAKEFIKSAEPDLESSISKYYELTQKANEYTSFTENVTLGKFYNLLHSETQEPYAILGGINYGEINNKKTNENNYQKDETVKSGEIDFTGSTGIETIGLAIFNKDKLIGELNAIETISHLIISNEFKSTTLSIENPVVSNSIIDLYLSKNKPTKTKVYFVNGSPFVKINCKFNAKLLSIDNTSNINSDDFFNEIGDAASKYLKINIIKYLYKTSKTFHSDNSGIGKSAIRNFTNNKKWYDYNWLNNYKNCFFDVNVNTDVKSGLVLTEN